jgi:hypothetical protein
MCSLPAGIMPGQFTRLMADKFAQSLADEFQNVCLHRSLVVVGIHDEWFESLSRR